MLGDDDAARGDERAGAERGERLLAEVQRVGRIEKDDLEPPSAAGEPPELAGDVAARHGGAGLDAERPDVLLERLDGSRVALDERGVHRAARERLEADAARAREEIEHARVGKPRPERVHQGDPHLIGRRAGRRAPRCREPPPLELAGDYPHALPSALSEGELAGRRQSKLAPPPREQQRA